MNDLNSDKPKNNDNEATLGVAVLTNDGSFTIKHPEHGECYHSLMGAKFEAKELYVVCSGFETALTTAIHPLRVVDVGLGLGYNALSTIEAWAHNQNVSQNLHILSLEINPELVELLKSGKASWQKEWSTHWIDYSKKLAPCKSDLWTAEISHPSIPKLTCSWQVLLGDAVTITIPRCFAENEWGGWQFFWQDPFSKSKNPDLWTSNWFEKLKSIAAKEAVLVTYSVARPVKDALTQTGWVYQLIPTPGLKRKWLIAHLNNPF